MPNSIPVMIMAAGRGERMRPLTDTLPKPMLKVAGKPLLAHHLSRLSDAGFSRVVVNLAYKGDKIESWLRDGADFGLQVSYSREGEQALETGGGIRHALPLLGSGPFVVVNGDVFTDYPFEQLLKYRLAANDLAHLIMVPNPPQHPHGDFVLNEGRLSLGSGIKLTYSGMGIYRPELVGGNQPLKFPLAPLLKDAMNADRVSGEVYEGEWDDIGTPERLSALNNKLSKSP